MIVDVAFEERYWYPEDGGAVWLSGYQVIDPATGRYVSRTDPALHARGLRVAGVAGVRHHADAVAAARCVPGDPLVLRREPENPHDRNAIAVHAPGNADILGWVPRELASELAGDFDAGRPWSALLLREQRPSPRDPRTGITMLLGRDAVLELRRAG